MTIWIEKYSWMIICMVAGFASFYLGSIIGAWFNM